MANLQIKQGEIYWANLYPTEGHEQFGVRPVLIVQNNLLNRNLNTVVIAPITTNIRARGLFTTFSISKRNELKSECIALLYQLRCIDKQRLMNKAGLLTQTEIDQVKAQINLIF